MEAQSGNKMAFRAHIYPKIAWCVSSGIAHCRSHLVRTCTEFLHRYNRRWHELISKIDGSDKKEHVRVHDGGKKEVSSPRSRDFLNLGQISDHGIPQKSPVIPRIASRA